MNRPPVPFWTRRRLAIAIVVAAAAGALIAALTPHGIGRHAATRPAGATSAAGPAHAAGASSAGPSHILVVPGRPGPPRPVPILMYHVIAAPPPGAPNPSLYVNGPLFAGQMRALAAAGFHGVSLEQVWASWHRRGPLPRRPVVVSFDDGYKSVATHALPVLRGLGWPGVLNLEVGIMGKPFGLTPSTVKRLLDGGWEVDSHTIHHPDLTTVSATQLDEETAGARAEIRRRFGVPADFFCYPSGRTNATVEAAVARAGYLAATTTHPGLAEPTASTRFTLNRVRVNGGETPTSLLATLKSLGG